MDDVGKNYDIHDENITLKEEEEDRDEHEMTREDNKMQHSMENLKSSGSSSFTEITLTEVKEEDVLFRSTTPQSDSLDIEKEEFEIIQPCQAPVKQFDFFHPNPFTGGDVFGDDDFPEVDVTEQLPSDPFKGTDPFAPDCLLANTSEEDSCHDSFISVENGFADSTHLPLQSAGKDYGTFNARINKPLVADFQQSMEDLKTISLKSHSAAHTDIISSGKQEQNNDLSKEAIKPESGEDCMYESGSSHSSTVFNSFEAGSCLFLGAEEEDDGIDAHGDSSRRVNSFQGIQSIIAGSYTGFPLSPCDPEQISSFNDIQKIFEHHSSIPTAKELESTVSPEDEADRSSSDCEPMHDLNSNTSDLPSMQSLDVYDYKYGDMYFFTVRLDPGSPELNNHGPVCLDADDLKKEESNEQFQDATVSPEFDKSGSWESHSSKHDEPENHYQISSSFDHVDVENDDCPSCNELVESERAELQIPAVIISDSDESESNDALKSNPISDSSEQASQDLERICLTGDKNESVKEELCIDKQEIMSKTDHPTLNFDSDVHLPSITFSDSKWVDDAKSNLTGTEAISNTLDQIDASKSTDLFCLLDYTNGSANDSLNEQESKTNNDFLIVNETAGSDSSDLLIHSLGCNDSELINEWESSQNRSEAVQNLFCPLGDEEICTEEQLLPDFFSSKQDYLNGSAEFSDVAKYELLDFDPFSPLSSECASQSKTKPTYFIHDAPRLDSGFHEVGTPGLFSPERIKVNKCSIDLRTPGLVGSKNNESEIHLIDPFSPESVDTGIFDSETEHGESGYVTKSQIFSSQVGLDNVEEKETCGDNSSCEILSGSEHEDCYAFGFCPSSKDLGSSEETTQDGSCGEDSKPSSVYSNGSEISNCTSEMSFPDTEAFDPVKNMIFDFNTSSVNSVNMSLNDEDVPDCERKLLKKDDLVEIDSFCSELSKMVSSSSSDSVQQSVAEMLFGADPNTSSFYPWDFEKQHF
ncbi:hypothetical protein DNTS_030474 [Danionella cerebrum]|uniref:Uncharacterized protein n=1 Tax=Danionella cerebrum TaxID=2873325 RepID=A0A553MM01_9TELE|nr:hypothetical protein DNTS_030474 [Danionella translucida]